VLLVKRKVDNKLLAIKVISKLKIIEEETLSHIRNEKFVLEHVDSKFILKMDGFFQTETNLFFITECLETDLYYLLKNSKNKRFSEEEVAFFTIGIAVALQNLHDLNFTYRDLKPENVLINSKGFPVLCDFGLINLLVPTHKAYTMCGTPEYFAPELIVSNFYDERVDWWALGILM